MKSDMEGLASQQDTMGIMDSSLYYNAARGEFDAFKQHDSEQLKQLVTPFDKNTILHIHITARCSFSSYPRYYFAKNEARPSGPWKEVSINFVESILQNCPDLLYQKNAKDETLLHIAARHGHEDIMRILFTHENKKLDQEAARMKLTRMVNKVKDSALHEAVRYDHLKVVEELIKKDGDYSYEVNDAGETPLYLAAEKGFSEAVDKIFGAANLPAYQGPGERTALHAAVLREDKEMTGKILHKLEFLATKADEQGWLPLHHAAALGFLPIVKILLDKDKSTAYIANEIDNQKTPLHLAAKNGRNHIMEELISRCPGCWEQVDARGRNVLHYAAESGNISAVGTILDDTSLSNLIYEKDRDGYTPLRQKFTYYDRLKYSLRHPKGNRLDFILSPRNLWDSDGKISKKTFERKGVKSDQRIVKREESRREKSKKEERNKEDGSKEESKEASSEADVGKMAAEADSSKEESKEASSEADDGMMAVVNKEREPYLIVATLIATVTFAAALTMPGGYRSDPNDPKQGHAILTKELAFKAFVISDATALTLSCTAVFCHLFMAWNKKPELIFLFVQAIQYTIGAMFAMVVAFITGTYAVLSHSSGLAIATTILCCYFPFYLVYSYRFYQVIRKSVKM